MKLTCGTDIVEISKVEESIQTMENKWLKTYFNDNEIDYCMARGKARYMSFAGKYAAKEACFKAISESLPSDYQMDWRDMEIKNDENGKPHVLLTDELAENINYIEITISHSRDYATATAIAMINN